MTFSWKFNVEFSAEQILVRNHREVLAFGRACTPVGSTPALRSDREVGCLLGDGTSVLFGIRGRARSSGVLPNLLRGPRIGKILNSDEFRILPFAIPCDRWRHRQSQVRLMTSRPRSQPSKQCSAPRRSLSAAISRCLLFDEAWQPDEHPPLSYTWQLWIPQNFQMPLKPFLCLFCASTSFQNDCDLKLLREFLEDFIFIEHVCGRKRWESRSGRS